MYSSISSLAGQSQDDHPNRASRASSISRVIRFADEDRRYVVDTAAGGRVRNAIEMNAVETDDHSTIAQSMNEPFPNHLDEDLESLARGRQPSAEEQRPAGPAANGAYAYHFRSHSRNHSSSLSRHSLRRFSSQDELLPYHAARQVIYRAGRNLSARPSNETLSVYAPNMGRISALILLVCSSAMIAACAECLVNTIDAMVIKTPLSELFIGLIILPIAGNVAEHITALTVAAKNKMDLAISVSVGSANQIALFVTPVIVIAGWIMNQDMTLYFSLYETVTLVATTLLVNVLILNGRTNVLEGGLLCACYFIIG